MTAKATLKALLGTDWLVMSHRAADLPAVHAPGLLWKQMVFFLESLRSPVHAAAQVGMTSPSQWHYLTARQRSESPSW